MARDDGWRRMKEKVVGCNTPLDFKLLQTHSLKLVKEIVYRTIFIDTFRFSVMAVRLLLRR